MQPPEAWYADPDDPTRLRWWDGRAWTGHTTPMPSSAGVTAAPYRPAAGLARASIVLVALMVVSEVALTAVSVPSYNRISDALSSGRDVTDVVTAYDAIALLQVPLEVAAYIVTCLWLRRARVNAEALNPASPHVRGRGWVWGGWICPVVNWWFPYQVVRDVSGATARGDSGVGTWWAWFLVWIILGNLGIRLGGEDALPALQGMAALAAIIAGARWARLVRAIGHDQQHAAERRDVLGGTAAA